MKGGENMSLMVKDLMQDLEKGNRTETHIKNRLAKKNQTNQMLSPSNMWTNAVWTTDFYPLQQYTQSIPLRATQVQQLGTMQPGTILETLRNTTGGI